MVARDRGRHPGRQPLRAERSGRRLAVLRRQARLVRATSRSGCARRATRATTLVIGRRPQHRARPTSTSGTPQAVHGGTHVSRAERAAFQRAARLGPRRRLPGAATTSPAASRGGTTGPAFPQEPRHADRPPAGHGVRRGAARRRRDRPRGAQGPAGPVRPRAARRSTSTSRASRSTRTGTAPSRGSPRERRGRPGAGPLWRRAVPWPCHHQMHIGDERLVDRRPGCDPCRIRAPITLICARSASLRGRRPGATARARSRQRRPGAAQLQRARRGRSRARRSRVPERAHPKVRERGNGGDNAAMGRPRRALP